MCLLASGAPGWVPAAAVEIAPAGLGWVGLTSVVCSPVPVHSQEYCISSILKASLRVHQCGEKGADRNTLLCPGSHCLTLSLRPWCQDHGLALFILAVF